MAEIFVEKYRPSSFVEVIGLPKSLPGLIGEDMPHMLFYGTPGTGKTTCAKIIINMLDCDKLILNASDERGIDTVRDKVKNFAMTKSSNDKFKVVHLDEADKLTNDAQESLRNMMETYAKNCRFILTCNHVSKITAALQSRCAGGMFEFKMPSHEEVVRRLMAIAHDENIQITADALQTIVDNCKNDIRYAINILQQVSALGRPITKEDIKMSSDVVIKIHELLATNDFLAARQLFLDSNVECDQFLVDYHDYVMALTLEKKLNVTKTANIVINIADALSKMHVISKEIIVEAFFIKIIGVLK